MRRNPAPGAREADGSQPSPSFRRWRQARASRCRGWDRPLPSHTTAAAALFISPASAIAATSSSDSISGYELRGDIDTGPLVGIASGALPGAWSVTVDHTPLGTSAAITGGDFHLATRLDGTLTAVTGDFTGGTVTQLPGFTGCVNQRYAVNGVLGGVGSGSAAAALAPSLPR